MTMTAVDSSNIAAIGFADGLMRVAFKNGNEYEYPGVTAEQHAAVMAADSKGRAINALVAERAGVVALKSVVKESLTTQSGPVHSTQAEGCCGQHLNKASMAGVLDNVITWECPKCSTLYLPKRYGHLVNWEAHVDVLVFKL